jgi:hypothetical protein
MNNKSIAMTINETRLSLIDVCNKSGLPACILEMMLDDLYAEVKHLAQIQLKQDEERYKNTNNNNNDENTVN